MLRSQSHLDTCMVGDDWQCDPVHALLQERDVSAGWGNNGADHRATISNPGF